MNGIDFITFCFVVYLLEGVKPWYLYLDGSSEHCAHTWSEYRYFELLKAFRYIDRVVKSEKTYFTSYVSIMF